MHESFCTLKSRNLGTPSNLFAPNIILFLGTTGHGLPKYLKCGSIIIVHYIQLFQQRIYINITYKMIMVGCK